MLFYNITFVERIFMKAFILCFGLILMHIGQAAPRLVSSIYPLQQIAEAISGEPVGLIADSPLSVHTYRLTPKDARQIAEADIVIWVGEVLMPQLNKYIARRQDKGLITVAKLPKIKLLAADRQPNQHEQDNHGHNNHLQKENAEHHHSHEHFSYDPHLWLSTDNAAVIAEAISEALIAADAPNTPRYQANLAAFKAELTALHEDLISQFESAPPPPYFVFHDAYAYFEQEFGLSHQGLVRTHAGQSPKARQIVNLKKQLTAAQQACLFKEPQFRSPIINKLSDNTTVKVATLDPIGYRQPGDGYAMILRRLANALSNCRQTQ